MAKRRKPQDIRAYRSKLALGKRLGVISHRIDARSHKPTKYMSSKLKKLADVLEGRVAAVKAPRAVVSEFRSAGARIVNGRILVEQRPGVKTSFRKGQVTEGVIYQRRPLDRGYFEEEITLPVSLHNVGDMLQWLKDHNKQLTGLKNRGDQWGFKINGYRSKSSFGGFEELVDYLSYYTNIDQIEQVAIDEHPEFLTIWRVKEPEFSNAQRAATFEMAAENRRAARRRRTVQDRREGQERPAFYRDAKKALSQKERNERYRLKHLDDYNAKGKARAAKSRASKKGK